MLKDGFAAADTAFAAPMCDGGAGVLQTIVNDTRQLGELEAA